MIRYGVNPIGWINDDDLSLGDHIPLEQCLREAAEIGFEGIEMGRKMPADPRALRGGARAARPGTRLRLVLARTALARRGGREGGLDARLRLLREMGCEVCILSETSGSVHGDRNAPLSARPTLSGPEWPGFAGALTEIARHVAGEGLVPVYHPPHGHRGAER